jgi:Domain of unknown function (DUF4160)
MPKVWEQDGFRFYIYYNDHTPSHVHVQKAEGEAIIYLGDADTKPSLREVRGMSLREVKKALEIASQQQRRLENGWRRIHD